MTGPPVRTLSAIFRKPVLIASFSFIGLVSALVGDDAWDGVSWATPGSATATIVWFALLQRG